MAFSRAFHFFFSKCYNRIKMFIFCLSKITCMFISDRVHAKYRFNDGPWSTSLTDSTFGWPIQSWSKISIINGFDVWMTTRNLMLYNVKNNHLIKPWLWYNSIEVSYKSTKYWQFCQLNLQYFCHINKFNIKCING